MKNTEEILIVDNFLSIKECEDLLLEAKDANKDKWFCHGDYDNIQILKSRNHKLLIEIKKRLSLFFEKTFQIQLVQAIHKTDQTTIWASHADNEGGKEIQYGVVIYINNDFIGGNLSYTNLNYQIKPLPGTMVIHPADELYRHEVTKVIKGERYALTTFVRDMSTIK